MAAAPTISPARLARLIVNLDNGRPDADAPHEASADWHEEKARVLEMLAGAAPAKASFYRQRAVIAREMAAEYRRAGA